MSPAPRRLPILGVRGLPAVAAVAAAVAAVAAVVAVVAAPPQPPRVAVVPHLVGEEDYALDLRIKEAIDDWDPRKIRNPYVETVPGVDAQGGRVDRRVIIRRDLAEFIADVEAAEALGKAFFWDMQAGSDFRRSGGSFVGTACASCHYRAGADARDTHTTRIPYVVWEKYLLDNDHPLAFGEKQLPFEVEPLASQSVSIEGLYDPRTRPPRPAPTRPGADDAFDAAADDEQITPLSLIVGSQGVPRLEFTGLEEGPPPAAGDWQSENGEPTPVPEPRAGRSAAEWTMFVAGQKSGGRRFRQITARNSPTAINAVFSDRLFHDGRAESTFNGFSIFGDDDRREVIHVRRADGAIEPVTVALSHAALASQAVGPIVSDVEMSYHGRTFPDLARKLLPSPVLGYQQVADDDSHLGAAKAAGLVGPGSSYRRLIQRAFRREWWDGSVAGAAVPAGGFAEDAARVPLVLSGGEGGLMEANFPLYWGLAILLYQAGLVSNESPFDSMMAGDPAPLNRLWEEKHERLEAVLMDRTQTRHPPPAGVPRPPLGSGAEVFQLGFRLFFSKGCRDCHEGPLFSEPMNRLDNGESMEPIARLVEHSLLPNSRGDAIGLVLEPAHRRVLERVADAIVAAGAPSRRFAERLALDLDLLREEARGSTKRMTGLVTERLRAVRIAEDGAGGIADLLIGWERNRAASAGRRTFFTEDERVDLAKLIADPLLVERTPIPTDLLTFRRPLPFAGPYATRPYAFYDMGFYNLGVAPPRYDRGVGDFSSTDFPSGEQEKRRQTAVGHVQVASGSAYRFDPEWRTGRYGAIDAGRDAGASADTSWFRDVPGWPGGDYPQPIPSQRRADVHFFSRSRRLVLSETPWGHRKPLLHDNELLFWGSFKTPSLRNVALTPPYMHNGRVLTIEDVLEFYDRGGDVPVDRDLNPDKHPAMRSIDLSLNEKLALAFLLESLTDERVQHEQAPFDHPALVLANGYAPDGTDKLVTLTAVGAAGVADADVPPSFPAAK